ncbi:hypothetical protein V6Z98_002446 [Aspergillus fumigatus]
MASPPPSSTTTASSLTTSTSSSSSQTSTVSDERWNPKFMDDFDLSELSELSSPPASPQSPPSFIPSPPPSQDAGESSSAARGQDGLSPARKKRRVATPKERTTQHLDLSRDSGLSFREQQAQVDLLVKTLRRHRKIVVIAGAGISTSAGIPDFRSTDGLFKSLQKKHNLKASGKLLFDAAVYQDESLTASFQDMVRSLSEEAAKTCPTAFHHMLARLAQENRLTRLYTQNIDGIETSMPPLATQIPLNVKAPWPRTIQLHGSLDKMVCQKCRHLLDFDREMFNRPDAPECPECSKNNQFRIETGQRSHGIGKMRPRIVLYNEHNPDEEAITSVMNADIRSRPDALIVVGTSLKIPGVRRLVKSLCSVIRTRRNGVTMWINNEPPAGKEFEDCWDLMVKGDCDEVARLAGLKRWDDDSEDVFDECNSSEVERVKKEQATTRSQQNCDTSTHRTAALSIIPPAGDAVSKMCSTRRKAANPRKPHRKRVRPRSEARKSSRRTMQRSPPLAKSPKPQGPRLAMLANPSNWRRMMRNRCTHFRLVRRAITGLSSLTLSVKETLLRAVDSGATLTRFLPNRSRRE